MNHGHGGNMLTTDALRREDIERARAGFASRAIAFMLDLLIVAIVLELAELFLQLLGTFFPIHRFFAHFTGIEPGGQYRSEVALAVAIVVLVAYNAFWWTMIGETPGKAVLGLRVVRTNGQRLTVWRSIVRAFAYGLSGLPLFLGFLWILVDDRRQGWHDKIADTCVIYVRQAQPAQAQPATRTNKQAAKTAG